MSEDLDRVWIITAVASGSYYKSDPGCATEFVRSDKRVSDRMLERIKRAEDALGMAIAAAPERRNSIYKHQLELLRDLLTELEPNNQPKDKV